MDSSAPSGSLKISLKLGQSRQKAPERQNSFQQQCPFQLMKESLPPPNPLLGSKDLISLVGLGEMYHNYCTPGKLKPDLASYLPQLSHTQNLCSSISSSISLRQLIEKPPKTGQPIVVPSDLKGFQLTPGPVAEAYRLFDTRDVHKLIGPAPTNPSTNDDDYDEFGKNFNDPEEVKKAHRHKSKRTLEEIDSVLIPEERRPKKHKKEKKRNKKDKKRDKKDEDEPGASFY